MPRPSCIVCSDKKRRPQIDAALLQGSTVTHVSERFKIVHESVRRHARNHLGLAGPSGRKEEQKAVGPITLAQTTHVAPEQEPISDVEPVSLRSPDDVLSALEWSVAETRDLLQRAKASGDLKLQNQLLQTCIGALDKLARSAGLYSDGSTVTINTGERKVMNVIGALSDEQLEALRGVSDEQFLAIVGTLPGAPND